MITIAAIHISALPDSTLCVIQVGMARAKYDDLSRAHFQTKQRTHVSHHPPPPPLSVDQFYFNFAVASNETTGSFRIVSGGDGCDDYDTDLSGVVTVPNTGGWEDFDDLAV